jgi:hypothetical protein
MFKSDQINELASALALAQSEIGSAKKDNKAYGYSYSDLATVIEAVKVPLNKNGLSFTQLIEEGDTGFVRVTTMLLHSSGQYIGSTGSTEIPEMKGCNLAQRSGAAQSYLKRYQLQALTGLPTEDNDASSEGFSANKSFTEVKKETQQKPEAISEEKPKPTTAFKRPVTNNSGSL